MRRSYGFPSRPQNGWDTTSHDYHDHISRMEKKPSVPADVPRYPNLQKVFNNKYYSYQQQQEEEEEDKPEVQLENHKQNSGPKAEKKVRIAEHVETIEQNKDGSYEVREESIDVVADGFIQQRHRRFDLCKWNSFKVH